MRQLCAGRILSMIIVDAWMLIESQNEYNKHNANEQIKFQFGLWRVTAGCRD